MSYKTITDVWGSYKDPSGKLLLEINADHNLVVYDAINRNIIASFTPKIKSKVLYEVVELLGFTNKL